MKNVISNITFWWGLYWQEGIFQYLLLAAALFLLIFRRKEKGTRQILPYTAIVLLIYFCPISAFVIQKCIGGFVYWRTLWLLPVIPAVALAGAELLGTILDKIRLKRWILNTVLTLLFILTAAVSVRTMLTSGDYVKVSNLQKVPEEVAQICNIVLEHADPEDDIIRMAADEHVSSYVRVYDASIYMPFGRRGNGAFTTSDRRLRRLLNAEKIRYKLVSKRAQQSDCDFVVVKITERYRPKRMKRNGYVMVGQVNTYGIFKRVRIKEFKN